MPPWGAIKRSDLIYYLRLLGFSGPFSGGKHQFMIRGDLRLPIPNPHTGDIGRNLLAKILQAGQISRAEWESLD